MKRHLRYSRKSSVAAVVLCLLMVSPISSMYPLSAHAGDFDGIKEVKALWDVRIFDEDVFVDRLELIQHTAEVLRKNGVQPVFVIALNGPAVLFATRTLKGTTAEGDDIDAMKDIQKAMQRMRTKGIIFKMCGVSMKRNKVSSKNVIPMMDVQENIWANILALQNNGYAYMPLFEQ